MAQTPKQSQQHSQILDQQQQQQVINPSSSDIKNSSKDPLRRFTPSRLSSKSTTQSVDNSSSKLKAPLPSRNHQPSKIFINKCCTELQSLLDSIKDNYHQDIKSLYGDELFADLFVQIGDEFKKPLHKCIIASRAFKLYSALKGFKFSKPKAEEDIIVSKFQEDHQQEEQHESEGEEAQQKNTEEGEGEEAREDSSEDTSKPSEEDLELEGVESIVCQLPEDLIGPELFLNFVRRAYLNQDLSDEEIRLNQRFVAWFKLNKPELIRPTVKHSPAHRESFRTIQPDFEQLSISRNSPIAMSTAERTASMRVVTADADSNVDESEEGSRETSMRDESLTGSLLTRTETFELISKSHPDTPSIGTPTKNLLDLTDDEKRRSDAGHDESESSEPYAPTTRTGLKPKKFTTPVGIRNSKTGKTNTNKTTPASGHKRESTGDTNNKGAKAADASVARSGAKNKQQLTNSPASRSSSVATKHSNQSTSSTKPSPTKPTTKTATISTKATAETKTKPTVIARAHPISMERSQSPGTNFVKPPTKNFIAANKRSVAQSDKRLSSQSDQTTNYDSETEISDASHLAFDMLTTENLAAQMDKFTLVSYSKLAEALSRMFIDCILTDTIILVRDGKQINAHKCILAARSAYLNDLINQQQLPTTTSETASSGCKHSLKIDLSEFSYPAVYFSILHIYSGIVKVPNDIDLGELAKLSHLLHVNTLRQVCIHSLRMNYCHYFHKPCNVCCIGVLKTLPLAWRYDYTELYSKCLQLIGSHFASIFCLEEFSKLKPHDLIEECYSATLSQLTPDNVIQRTIECQKLLKNLPRVKWTESVICLVGRQLEDFCHYVADNYEKILQSESFLNLGKTCWECEVLEENLLAAMNHLRPDSGCKTLIQLDKIECSIESYCDEPRNASDSFVNLISKMRKYCERYLLKDAAAVVHCSSWRQMNPSLQKRIKDQAILATDFDEPNKQLSNKPKLASVARHQKSSSPQQQLQQSASNQPGSEGTRSPSNRSTPDSRLKSPSTTYLPPPKNKPAAARHVKVLK